MSTSRKLKIIIALSLGLFVLMLITGIKLTAIPAFCISCHHDSAKEWQESTHSKLRCVDCHRLSSVDKWSMLINSAFKVTAVRSEPVPCLSCHSAHRVVTPPKDIKIPHQQHLVQRVDCNSCHPAMGHLNPGSKAGQEFGRETLVMALCMRCHYREGGPLDCKDCHRDPPITPEHLQPQWIYRHGPDARKDVAQCNACHKYTLYLNPETRSEQVLTAATDYARQNEFCTSCHGQRPKSHNLYFLHDHPGLAIDDKDSCPVCHDWNSPLPVEEAATLFCQKCHAVKGWIPLPYSRYSEPPTLYPEIFSDDFKD